MNLSRASLAKIYLSFHLGWLHDIRLSESDEGGVIYLQAHPYSYGHGQAIFAGAKGKGVASIYEIDGIRAYGVYMVLPCDIISSSLFSDLEKLEQSGGGFRIDVVADVGKDASTDEMRYSYCGFDDVDMFADAIRKELVTQSEQTDLNFDSVPGFRMRAAFRRYLAKYLVENHRECLTLRQVNERISNAKKHLLRDDVHFEELVGEKRDEVMGTVVSLSIDGLTPDEVKSKTIAAHGIADCKILDELITDIQSTKEVSERNKLKEEKTKT